MIPLPGLSAGTRAACFAVHLGVERIAQAQFDAGAELVPQAGSDVGPAPGGDEQVNAVGQTLGGYGGDGRLQLGEVLADDRPAVDDEEDVTVAVVTGEALPGAQNRGDMTDDAVNEVAVVAAG